MTDERVDSEEHKPFTVIEHLEELRRRLIRCGVAVGILFYPAYYVSLPLIEWMKRVVCPDLKHLVFIQPLEMFFTRMKVAFFLSLLVAFPYVAYQVWAFVSPALFKHERGYVRSFTLTSAGLFLGGAVFAFFLICPAVMNFSMSMASADIAPMVDVQSFVNVTAMLMLGFGVMFQLPIFVFILSRTGLVPTAVMRKYRSHIIVGIFIAAAVLTPTPDVASQLAMAIPALLLFEASLLVSRFSEKRRDAGEKS